MASATSCDDLNSRNPQGEIETSFTNTDDETDQSVELSVRLVNEFYGAGDSQSFGSVEDGATSKTITLQGAVVGVNTIEFLDTAGQVVHRGAGVRRCVRVHRARDGRPEGEWQVQAFS